MPKVVYLSGAKTARKLAVMKAQHKARMEEEIRNVANQNQAAATSTIRSGRDGREPLPILRLPRPSS